MATTVIVHLYNEDPFVAEVEKLPDPTDVFVEVINPRRKDGKDLLYISRGAERFLFPWHRITLIEVITGDVTQEEVIGFFRD
jgi:hypothetical protein